MRIAATVISLLAPILSACAQDFHPQWIFAPQADSLSHVWFRQAYTSGGRPRQAILSVTTTGVVKVYVNECNVGTALCYPSRYGNDTTAVTTTFDVTPYLRPDTNVVAIAYSPGVPRATMRQVAASFHGTAHDGSLFCHQTDSGWLCRRANSSMTAGGGEIVDARGHSPSWKAATTPGAALWTGAQAYHESNPQPPQPASYGALTVSRVRSLDGIHISQNPVLIYLSAPYWGFPRITLREARRGERLQIGNLTYICSGTMDEQAYPVFANGSHSVVAVSGDKRFKPSQITAIELISTSASTFPADYAGF